MRMEKLLYCCQSIKGIYQEKNQDRVICSVSNNKMKQFAIACACDGIGSLEMSELSSELITVGLKNWFYHMENVINRVTLDDLLEDLEETIFELNELVYEYKESHSTAIGCTMSLLLIVDREYFTFHVGDSRIYLLTNMAYQLTVDEVQTLSKEGQLKTYLTNYMGREKKLWLNKTRGFVEKESLFLIGTDGLFKKFLGEDFNICNGSIHTDSDLERVTNQLVQTVLMRGERDNISCILLYFSENIR